MLSTFKNKRNLSWVEDDRFTAKKQADYLSKLYEFRENMFEANKKQLYKTVLDMQSRISLSSDSRLLNSNISRYSNYHNDHKPSKSSSKTNNNFFRNHSVSFDLKLYSKDYNTDETCFTRIPALAARSIIEKPTKKKNKTQKEKKNKQFAIMNNCFYETSKGTTDVLPVILNENIEFVGRLHPSSIESVNRIKKVLNLNTIYHEKSSIKNEPETKCSDLRVSPMDDYVNESISRSKTKSVEAKLPVLVVYGQKPEQQATMIQTKTPSLKSSFSSYTDVNMPKAFVISSPKEDLNKYKLMNDAKRDDLSVSRIDSADYRGFSNYYKSPAPSPDYIF